MHLLFSLILTWSLVQNHVTPGVSETTLTLTNDTHSTLTAEGGWQIGYCQMSVAPLSADPAEIRIEQVCASYHVLTPTADFQPLHPGESRTYHLRQRGTIMRLTGAPQGAYFVPRSGQPSRIEVRCPAYTDPRLFQHPKQTLPQADGEWLYALHQQHLAATTPAPSAPQAPVIPLLPMPKQVSLSANKRTHPQHAPKVIYRHTSGQPAEGYHIDITTERILIHFSSPAGRFYADQTLHQLRALYPNGLPTGTITDYPDYPYRGFMLDIARNFTPKHHIIHLLHQLASYKINRLHFHIADDEAWRLEIPGLPELTQMASLRGITRDESSCLYPAYSDEAACGHLTRADYIDILRTADSLHICVIPEIDLPGHSRAAIRAMEARYRHYEHSDPAAASEYRLYDPAAPKRNYVSAQYYTDNVMAVHLPSAERFVLKVLTELRSMHDEAGMPLVYFNIGGDEVAAGALSHEEHLSFIRRLYPHLKEAGIRAAGWEEVAEWIPASERPLCYCWHPSQKSAAQLAQQGYPIVLSCADYLYVDMCYVNHPEEKALHWAAYTDEYKTLAFTPQVEGKNVLGIQAQLFAETIRNYDQIQQYLFPKMYGIIERAWNRQSSPAVLHSWTSILNAHLALREHSAYPCPPSSTLTDSHLPASTLSDSHTSSTTSSATSSATHTPTHTSTHLPYHLTMPGIHVTLSPSNLRNTAPSSSRNIDSSSSPSSEASLVEMLCPVSDATIRYTLDGTDPTPQSPAYTAPFALPAGTTVIRARAFTPHEHSACTWWHATN